MAVSPEHDPMKRTDRILVLSVMEGKKSLDSLGNSDKRLFTGENKLHGLRDPITNMWRLKYEMGAVPEVLKGNFTSFNALKKHADLYYNLRNIEIKEVID